jgi:hypothetical protein
MVAKWVEYRLRWWDGFTYTGDVHVPVIDASTGTVTFNYFGNSNNNP